MFVVAAVLDVVALPPISEKQILDAVTLKELTTKPPEHFTDATLLDAMRYAGETFDDDTPEALIARLRPDVLVKGGDWSTDAIVGADEVRGWGGSVHSIPFRFERSTTAIPARVRAA